jgi:hypothetical protein
VAMIFIVEYKNGSELIIQQHRNIIYKMYELAQNKGMDNNINIVLHHTTCNNDEGSANIYKKILSLRYCTSSPIRVVCQMGHLLGLLKTQFGTGGGDSQNFRPLQDAPCLAKNYYIAFYDKLILPNHNVNFLGTSENVTCDTTNSNSICKYCW